MYRKFLATLTLGGLMINASFAGEFQSLFDGETFNGWNIRKGEEQWWKVRDGIIVGGSLEKKVPRNTFLATDNSFENFELHYAVRFVKKSGFANSGVQVRSIRKPNHHEMSGYQVDAGPKWWGKMYDESRRNKVIADHLDTESIMGAIQEDGWNLYRVLCEGPRIRTWINGVAAFDFTEKDPTIPLNGIIGLQAHGGGTFEVQFKDLKIKELPPTPNAPLWPATQNVLKPKKLSVKQKQLADKSGARTPTEELASFTVPEGFVVELVASEEQGVGKPITVQWDAQGRMWTMTAFEYPMDANENKAAAVAKYAAGGRDKVLVFDNPYGPGPHTPRIFADGLVIPLGILPAKDGVYVQYGPEIRLYTDSNADGTADGFDVVLQGFGIQDSHLFPHQFERAPGGWIYCAQGLFNFSSVTRPGNKPFADGRTVVPYMQCKQARFKPDGSAFESVSAGPNNIWGFLQKNDGEIFLQEANDMGIPVTEFLHGAHYTTGSKDKLRSYAPQIPRSLQGNQMGGTGLSGIALTEDSDSGFNTPFGDAENVFYIANPIMNKVQVITSKRDAQGHHLYKKQADFLTTTDNWFRPVAVHFGPDGCLYVVDWYNKIISHNEVPRTHPDRDKTRGRIWRIRPANQHPLAPPNLMQAPATDLLAALSNPNERIARFAWHAIADRNEQGLRSQLEQLALSAPILNARVLAIWCLEDLGALTVDLLGTLARDEQPNIRFEAVRAVTSIDCSPQDAVSILKEVPDDANYRVRAALANTVRSLPEINTELVGFVAALGKERLNHGDRRDYDRNFERYLARWAMEVHHEETATFLDSSSANHLSSEQRLLAIQTLPPEIAAIQLLKGSASMGRQMEAAEVEIIVQQLGDPEVNALVKQLLADPAQRAGLLKTLTKLNAALRLQPDLGILVEDAVRNGFKRGEPVTEALPTITAFRLERLEPEVKQLLREAKTKQTMIASLVALQELGSTDVDTLTTYLDHADLEVRRRALMTMSSIPGEHIVNEFAERWDALPGDLRQVLVVGLSSSEASAEALARAASEGQFDGLTGDMADSLLSILGIDHPAMQALLTSLPGLTQPVIELTGSPDDAVMAEITLEGPFTVEAWVNFAPNIDNNDNLLGRKNDVDFNFFAGRLRIWEGPGKRGDLIVANRELEPNIWIHCAITRDVEGNFRIYHDGELDNDKSSPSKETFQNLSIGTSNAGKGANFRMREFRVWNVARSDDEIRSTFQTDLKSEMPEGLVTRISGDTANLPLRGKAKVSVSSDFPELITWEEAAKAKAKFDRYMEIVSVPGDATTGQGLFAMCTACHKVNGVGGVIGPNLSGAGAMGDESLLHNILTPNASMESGYYRHDIIRKDGSKVTGALIDENDKHMSIQPIGGAIVVVPREDITRHTIAKKSLMPEGLLDHLTQQQVADLFAYIRTLTGSSK